MPKKSLSILSVILLFLIACNLTTATPPTASIPTVTPIAETLTFTEPIVGFRFDYPASLAYQTPMSPIPYLVTFADFDITDERYLGGELERPANPQIIELTVNRLQDGVITLDDMRTRSHESFESGMFLGTTLNREERRSIGAGLEANIYFMTLRDGSETTMAETMINGYGIYFRAFGGSETLDIILTSLVIE